MTSSDELSRRNLLKASAAALAAAAARPVRGANDKIALGWIGVGSRGDYLMERFYKGSPELGQVVAVCDTYADRLAKAKDHVQTAGGNTPQTYVDYRELLANPGVDAVFIATPEHLHYPMFMAAIKAGKNIYVEKPLAHTIEQGEEMVKAARASGKVVQVGTQNRSNTLYIKAKQMVADGLIGNVHYVRAFWYRNAAPGQPAPWRNYEIPADATPANTDWEKFLGPAPQRPFSKERYYQWRLYWDYSGGISTDLLVHQTDITNFVCHKHVPESCMASGGIYRWGEPDDREVPDTLSALYDYKEPFHINYSCYLGNQHYGFGENFLGDEGTIEVLNRSILNFYPEKFRGHGGVDATPPQIAARQEQHIEIPGNDNKAVEAHIHNFLEAVLGKAQVVAPTEVGQQAAISGHMATLSFRSSKKVLWNDATRTVSYV